MTHGAWREAKRILVLALLGFLMVVAVMATAVARALRG